jgi:hypothetical protein
MSMGTPDDRFIQTGAPGFDYSAFDEVGAAWIARPKNANTMAA